MKCAFTFGPSFCSVLARQPHKNFRHHRYSLADPKPPFMLSQIH